MAINIGDFGLGAIGAAEPMAAAVAALGNDVASEAAAVQALLGSLGVGNNTDTSA